MFKLLGRFVSRHWKLVLVFWVATAVLLLLNTPPSSTVEKDGNNDYMPQTYTSVRGEHLLQQAFPGPSPLLSDSNVIDPSGFALCLAEACENSDDCSAKYLGEKIQPELAELFEKVKKAKLDNVEQKAFYAAVNKELESKSFYDPKYFTVDKWREDARKISLGDPKSIEKLNLTKLRKWNRFLLESEFPEYLEEIPITAPASNMVVVVERYLPPGMTQAEFDQLDYTDITSYTEEELEALSEAELTKLQEMQFGLTEEDQEFAKNLASSFTPEWAEENDIPLVNVLSADAELVGEKFTSPDNKASLILLGLKSEFMEVQNDFILGKLNAELDKLAADPDTPKGLRFGITGSAAIGGDMIAASRESIKNTEVTTVILVLTILFLVYRAPMLVLIPIITIGFSVLVALRFCTALALYEILHLFTTSKVFIIVILFGAGTDFCLFLISRYREELEEGNNPEQSVENSVSSVGKALAASAFTTIFGLGVMYFADFGKYHNSGPTIGLCLFITLLACLTLAPALLRAFSGFVFWPLLDSQAKPTREGFFSKMSNKKVMESIWSWSSDKILARPLLIMTLTVLSMCPLAYYGYNNIVITYDLLNELESTCVSVQGTEMLRDHFPAGEVGPVVVLVRDDQGGLETSEGRYRIGRLTNQIKKITDDEGKTFVTDVRSYAEPLGDVPSMKKVSLRALVRKHPKTKEHYLTSVDEFSGTVTRLEIILDDNPFSRECLNNVGHIDEFFKKISLGEPTGFEQEYDQSDPEAVVKAETYLAEWKGASFDLTGVSSSLRDLKGITESDLGKIQELVVLAVFAIIVIMLRKPVVCAFLMISVVFSYFVTMGTTQLVFQWYYAATFDGLDWKVPLFLFVILVAVGMDYNIYLITRVDEEIERSGKEEGIRKAIIHTGGIITSCGVIMAGTFFSMMTGTLRGMLELGFALSFGVLLDTLVIRTLIVPAFLTLWYNRDTAEKKGKGSHEQRSSVQLQPHTRSKNSQQTTK